jgi:hypothetical protein
MIGPGVVERVFGQCGSDAMAAQFFRDFGVHEDDPAVVYAIFERSQIVFDQDLELLSIGVINNFEWFHNDVMNLAFDTLRPRRQFRAFS